MDLRFFDRFESGQQRSARCSIATAMAGLAAVSLLGCGGDVTELASGERAPVASAGPALSVGATAWPVAWLVERLAGDRVEWVARSVLDLEPPSSPTAEQVLELAEADVVLVHGLDLEAWIATAALRESRLVVTTLALEAIEIEGPTHSHGPEGDHSHRSADPRTWTDPLLYLEQAQRVREALLAAAPGLEAEIEERSAALRADLTVLDEQLRTALEEPTVSWASAGGILSYLARRHRLEHRRFDLDPQEPPDDHELDQLQRWVEAHPSPVLVWDATPSAELLAALPTNLRHVVFDPLITAGDDGYRYLERMAANVERLAEVGRR